jgi:hypothetical protein
MEKGITLSRLQRLLHVAKIRLFGSKSLVLLGVGPMRGGVILLMNTNIETLHYQIGIIS